jgi:polysaccharide biosynthesis/export protein
MRMMLGVLIAFLLAACSSTPPPAPMGAPLAMSALASPSEPADDAAYRIGAGDLISVTVFQVPDLSLKDIRVDAQGNLQLPLLGSVRAGGHTPQDLSDRIATGLNARYLRNAQVSVAVTEAASQKVTIDGAVTKPGVYEMQGRTTLLQAVAMAEGPTRVASLDHVVVFREVEGERRAATLDLAAIRAGQAGDPVMQGDDIIIVGTSRNAVALREAVAVLPALSVFAYLR